MTAQWNPSGPVTVSKVTAQPPVHAAPRTRSLPARRCEWPAAATARPAAPQHRGERAPAGSRRRSAPRAASTRRDGQRGGKRTTRTPRVQVRGQPSAGRGLGREEGSAPHPELSRAEGFEGTRGAHSPARPSPGPHALGEVAQPLCGAAGVRRSPRRPGPREEDTAPARLPRARPRKPRGPPAREPSVRGEALRRHRPPPRRTAPRTRVRSRRGGPVLP